MVPPSIPTEHEIAIYGETAEVDGDRYSLSETAAEFKLTGPVSVNDRIIYINRLTGEFAILPAPGAQITRSNMEGGQDAEGCKKASQKF